MESHDYLISSTVTGNHYLLLHSNYIIIIHVWNAQ